MKVTVIGFWGGFPGKNEATSGYLVEHKDFKLLVDCGSGVISQMQNYIQVEELDAVIISHYHNDHVCDIGALQYGRLISGFLGKQMSLLEIYGHQQDQQGYESLTYPNVTKALPYDPESSVTIGPFSISFLQTDHPVPCYAMRIEADGTSFVYTADTSYKEEFVSFSKGTDLLICECNLYAGMDGKKAGHMTSTDAGLLAQQAGVKELLLTHLPHFGNHAELMEQANELYKGRVSLAKSGWSWTAS
ncbi:MBL fold metallo-hydrolase [Bacillus salitolerans]|uniref:MBL fold metallo-hydrolase n=1 Tax=Bacillus salitolerans TaxID=1437434 RepID=A0ABW4LX54_9BACI